MKTLIAMLFLFSSVAFASSKKMNDNSGEIDKLKWLKLGYEVAKAHAPDYEIASHIVAEKCDQEVETWTPDYNLGESYEYAPSKYSVTYYYEGSLLMPIYYRCKG